MVKSHANMLLKAVVMAAAIAIWPAQENERNTPKNIGTQSLQIESDDALPYQDLNEDAKARDEDVSGITEDVWAEASFLGTPVLVKLTEIGSAQTTGFCECRKCNGKWTGMPTASGRWAVEGLTVGIDPAVVAYGALVYVDGVVYRNDDKPARWAREKTDGVLVDVFYADHKTAWAHGRQSTTLHLVDEMRGRE